MCKWGRTAETMSKLYTRQVIRGFHIFGSYLCFPPCYFSIWLVCDPLYTLALPPFQKNPQLKKFLFILLSIHVFKCILFGGFLSALAIWKWPSWCVILSFLQEFLQEGNSCRKEFLQEGKGTVGCTGQGTLVFCKHKEHHLYFIIVIFYCFILLIYYLFYYLQATGSFRSFLSHLQAFLQVNKQCRSNDGTTKYSIPKLWHSALFGKNEM